MNPLLRRLEKQGLLQSRWNTDNGRPRRYYRLTEEGRRVLRAEAARLTWWVGVGLLWIAGALTLITGVDYLQKAMPHLKDEP